MILVDEKSPVNLNKPFSLRGDLIVRNTFYPLGKAPKGRYHVILISGTTIDWKNLTLHETTIEHSPECTQHFICGVEESIIGSLFVVAQRKVDLTPNRLAIVRHASVDNFTCNADQGAGGVIYYKDSHDNVVVIPSNIHPNSFLVSV